MKMLKHTFLSGPLFSTSEFSRSIQDKVYGLYMRHMMSARLLSLKVWNWYVR